MATGGLQDRNLSWDDISWIRVSVRIFIPPSCVGPHDIEIYADFLQRYTRLPIVVKGVQSIEDVELCVKHGAEGVMIVSLRIVIGSIQI